MPAPYELSSDLARIFRREVLNVVLNDPRTDRDNDLLYGYPRDPILRQVLRRGLTDFAQGYVDTRYGRLTPDQKVLLYCYFNQRKHLFACIDTYRAYLSPIQQKFSHAATPLVIDVGCGPATASLAFSEMWPGRNLHYKGIDSAPAMLAIADSFWRACSDGGLVGEESKRCFYRSWNDIDVSSIERSRPVIVVFSYLFGNPSLHHDVLVSLARFILKLANTRAHWPLHILYLNSTHDLANDKYVAFKHLLDLGLRHQAATPASIQYRTRRDGPICTERFLREMLVLKASAEHEHAA